MRTYKEMNQKKDVAGEMKGKIDSTESESVHNR